MEDVQHTRKQQVLRKWQTIKPQRRHGVKMISAQNPWIWIIASTGNLTMPPETNNVFISGPHWPWVYISRFGCCLKKLGIFVSNEKQTNRMVWPSKHHHCSCNGNFGNKMLVPDLLLAALFDLYPWVPSTSMAWPYCGGPMVYSLEKKNPVCFYIGRAGEGDLCEQEYIAGDVDLGFTQLFDIPWCFGADGNVHIENISPENACSDEVSKHTITGCVCLSREHSEWACHIGWTVRGVIAPETNILSTAQFVVPRFLQNHLYVRPILVEMCLPTESPRNRGANHCCGPLCAFFRAN